MALLLLIKSSFRHRLANITITGNHLVNHDLFPLPFKFNQTKNSLIAFSFYLTIKNKPEYYVLQICIIKKTDHRQEKHVISL